MRPPGMVGFGLCDLEPYRRHPERSRFSGGASSRASPRLADSKRILSTST